MTVLPALSVPVVRVVLADDHRIVRDGLRMLLTHDGVVDVVAEAATAQDALDHVRDHAPDVLVLDLSMPGRPSLEVLEEITAGASRTKVIMLTMQGGTGFVRRAMRAGARGYVLKESAGEDLVHAIEVVIRGGTYLTPSLGARLAAEPEAGSRFPDGLTPREAEVLGLLALGHTNAEIATRLHLSQRTVETHRANILAKSLCASRADLVRYAIAHGLVPDVDDPA